MSENAKQLESLLGRGYQHGFVTEIDSDTVPPGLDEDVVRLISRKKQEPAFLTEWRLKALRHWLTMKEPHWAHVKVAPIDYQAISYYSAPKTNKDGPKSLADVDPKLLATYEKLGVPLHERATAYRLPRRSRTGSPPPGSCSVRSRKPCARTRT